MDRTRSLRLNDRQKGGDEGFFNIGVSLLSLLPDALAKAAALSRVSGRFADTSEIQNQTGVKKESRTYIIWLLLFFRSWITLRMASYNSEAPVLDTYQAVVSAYSDFLTVAIHTILYERNIYPQTSFIKARKYNYPVRQSRHPRLCKWIMDAVASVEAEMLKVLTSLLYMV